MMVCELPGDVVVSILDHLPGYAKPWYRGLSQECAQHLSNCKVVSAKHPDLPLWLLKQHYSEMAARIDCSDRFIREKLETKQQAQLLAARSAAGDLAGVVWLRAQGCAWSSHSCVAAAEAGHLDVLRWLLSQRPACPLDAGLCALAAASAGQLSILEYLREEVLLRPFDLAACAEAAAAAGKQTVLDWLVMQDSALAATAAIPDQAAAATARQQVQQIMTYARARGPPAVAVHA